MTPQIMNMTGKIYTSFITAILLTASPAGNAQKIDYSRSQITFTSRQMNVPVEAKFNKFSAELAFDASRPESSKARIEVELSSFDIGNDEINSEIHKKEWFDTKQFPRATFTSTSVRPLGGGRYEVRGPLSIKGKSHEITAPFLVKTDAAGNSVFEGMFNIQRLRYGIGEGVWRHTDVVADEVQIRFRLSSVGMPLPKK
jgi:polyisoprenoid-binding protein YceI